MTWEAFLRYISGPGVAAVVAVILSLAIEYVPHYGYLDARQKRLVFAALCFVVPVIGALLLVVSGYEALTWDPLVWRAVVAGAAAFGAGTAAHTRVLRDKPTTDVRYVQER